MKEPTPPKDVFEANKFCNLIADIVGYKFVTINRDKLGSYHAFTSNFDKIKFLVAVIWCIWLFIDLSSTSIEKSSKRSLIFEIIIFLTGKIQGNQTALLVVLAFLVRSKYFEIMNNILRIDQKVQNKLLKNYFY